MAEALECLDDFKGKFPEQAHSSACDALDRDINAALFSKSDNGEDLQKLGLFFLFASVFFSGGKYIAWVGRESYFLHTLAEDAESCGPEE